MSWVYFIAPEALFHRGAWAEEAKVKIGFTRNHPHLRLNDLQCGSPVHLDLIAYIDGSPRLEKAFHGAFADLRSHGEWFYVHHKLRDFLGCLEPEDWRAPRYVTRDRVTVALYDTVFAPGSPYPEVTDEEYCQSANELFLEPWYPEVCEA